MNGTKRTEGSLSGKVAIVTGAGMGIGKAIVEVFVREGARVLAVDFSGDENAVARNMGEAVVPFNADMRDEAQVAATFAQAQRHFGSVDISVHNAATVGGLEPDLTLAEYERLTEVNLRGVLLCCKHAVAAMKPSGGGSIVNVASVAGLSAERQSSIVYSAAKAGVISLTRSFACHHAGESIRVNAIAPGMTLTEKQASLPESWRAQAAARSPMNRHGLPSEQAEVVAFLASDRASFVTGVTIPVDGGWSSHLA